MIPTMEKTAHSAAAPRIIDAKDFRPQDYAGREVVFVRVPEHEGRMGREVNVFGLHLSASVDQHPAIIGVMGAVPLAWEALTTRMTIGKMLLTDDQFAKRFRGGALMDIRERNLDAFTRYFSRESTLKHMIPDTINRYKMAFSLGNEVAQRGVGVMEAIREWRIGHWATVLPAAGAVLWSGYAMASGNHSFGGLGNASAGTTPPSPANLLDASAAEWRGKALGALTQAARGQPRKT